MKVSQLAPFHTSVEIEMDEGGEETEHFAIHLHPWVKWCPPIKWLVVYVLYPTVVAAMREEMREEGRHVV